MLALIGAAAATVVCPSVQIDSGRVAKLHGMAAAERQTAPELLGTVIAARCGADVDECGVAGAVSCWPGRLADGLVAARSTGQPPLNSEAHSLWLGMPEGDVRTAVPGIEDELPLDAEASGLEPAAAVI